MTQAPVLYWMRRDFRLSDNPALFAAQTRPVIPVFICDETVTGLGAAPRFRLSRAIAEFGDRLAGQGGRLILRRGDALAVLRALAAETGAGAVMWNRLYDPAARARDTRVKSALRAQGLRVESHNAHLLFEPWTVETGSGGPYRVYSPFWRAVRGRDVAAPLPAPDLTWPAMWPASDALSDWRFEAGMARGAAVVAGHLSVGAVAAEARLATFIEDKARAYAGDRDRLDRDGTSGLSEPLAYGEISPRRCWQAGFEAMQRGVAGAETFLKELVWREFASHLMFHFPTLAEQSWRREWHRFPWRGDSAEAERWRRGQTGVDVIDAAMRELYVTGRMHNRARMLVASYLTKHLMTDWRVGLDWFAETLTDWDPASNAMGWQWVAGSGPDAAPFFRIFNPETQAAKFDPEGRYRQHWLRGAGARQFGVAAPPGWRPDPLRPPMIGLAEGRARALAAYRALRA